MTFVVGDEKKFAELLAAHKGKVVFVDYWAIWCEPCVEFFPHTVETAQQIQGPRTGHDRRQLRLAGGRAKVRKFLADQGGRFRQPVSNYDDIGQDVAEAFEWSELPQFRLYDRTGKLRYEWTAKPEDLEQRIEELLAEGRG